MAITSLLSSNNKFYDNKTILNKLYKIPYKKRLTIFSSNFEIFQIVDNPFFKPKVI
jgi:hypothetical protein